MPAVDVDDVHGLGVFNDEVNTISDCDNPTKRPLHLTCYAVMLKNRLFAFVELHDVGFLRGDGGNIALDLVLKRLTINSYCVKRLIEDVSKHRRGTVKFAHKLSRSLASV